jgi:VanZ family protein
MLVGSTLPGDQLSLPAFAFSDKLLHAGEFAILTLLVLRAIDRSGRGGRALWLAGLVTYGALDELHQLWIPGRSAEFTDWVADTLGVLVGAGLVLLILKTRPAHSEPHNESHDGD